MEQVALALLVKFGPVILSYAADAFGPILVAGVKKWARGAWSQVRPELKPLATTALSGGAALLLALASGAGAEAAGEAAAGGAAVGAAAKVVRDTYRAVKPDPASGVKQTRGAPLAEIERGLSIRE